MASARLPGPSRRKVFARLLATALLLGFAYRVFAGGLPSVVGDWRGSLHPGEQTLRLELHVTSDAQGKLDVTLESVDQGEEVLTGSEVLFDGENFSFDVHSASAAYRGGLSADGKKLSGTWIQGGRLFPLDFTRQIHTGTALFYLAIALAALAALFTLLRFDDRIVAATLAQPWLRPVVVFAPLVLAIGLLATGYAYERLAEAADVRRYPAPGILVDVGGHRLELYCKGTGTPTVLIETGAGTPSYLWFPVQDGVAEFTRVCTYDRAGFGWSEAARLPLSMSQRTKELHTLLSRAGVPGPFVMMGHSYGGALVRLFAHEYSNQVVGLVLVDSTEEILASDTHLQDAIKTQLASLQGKKSASQFGITRFRLRNDPLLAAAFSTPAYVAETADESRSMLGIRTEMRGLGGPGALGDLPLAVISHGEPIGETPAGLSPGQFEQQWQTAQKRLAKLSSNSELVIAKHSSHNVELSQPGLIVDEINLVVAAVRDHVPLSQSRGTRE